MGISLQAYKAKYQNSIEAPENFWAEEAKCIHWFSPWTEVLSGDFETLDMAWFREGRLNASYNCLDRHLPSKKNTPALIWVGNQPGDSQQITFGELHAKVCQLANVLKQLGVQKGDRVCIYLPMIPEAIIAMLACARIGAIHSVVFSGFSAASLKVRLLDAQCSLLITADEAYRGDKIVPLKKNADEALADCPLVKKTIVVKRSRHSQPLDPARDVWYQDIMADAKEDCAAEIMDSSDPLFILYTSGSTGKPKGVVHATGGYMVYATRTFHYLFAYQAKERFWCTADVGWITGHTYGVYGPLANGATCIIYEGVPNYPTPARCWEIIDQHQVNIFYTSPTQIRALRAEGDAWVQQSERSSLRLLGSVGEPINPEVWRWYFEVVGKSQCPIIDTWWQTETGGILISPLPILDQTQFKAGSAGLPFFGVLADVVDDKGGPLPAGKKGNLVIRKPWPGLMQTIYKDKERFIEAYFKAIPGVYLSGDGAYYDKKGNFWISGRTDDVIKVSGHRLGTEELESALITHPALSEAAVVSTPDALRGSAIVAFVTLKQAVSEEEALKQELAEILVENIGAIARPKTIFVVPALPKTRSGKIMRRILRKIAHLEFEDLGDLSTLVDPEVVKELVKVVRD